MQLTLTRKWTCGPATIGDLAIDGVRACYTLEDRVRPAGLKVPGQTAIPAGVYQVVVTRSQRFGRDLPLLLDVPMFSGVRIHAGNTAADTEGCILVGRTIDLEGDRVGESRLALEALLPRIQAALAAGDQCSITIVNALNSPGPGSAP